MILKLRELEERDIEQINKWRNDPELIDGLGAPFRYINLDVEKNWYRNYMSRRGSQIRCAIVDEEDNILGLISLVNIDTFSRSCELHLLIGEKSNQGKGFGTFAVNKMIAHAFNNMNMNRIELTVLEDNIRAHKLYEKCGFKKEGTKRKAKFKRGKYLDMDIYAMLRSEHKFGGYLVAIHTIFCRKRAA